MEIQSYILIKADGCSDTLFLYWIKKHYNGQMASAADLVILNQTIFLLFFCIFICCCCLIFQKCIFNVISAFSHTQWITRAVRVRMSELRQWFIHRHLWYVWGWYHIYMSNENKSSRDYILTLFFFCKINVYRWTRVLIYCIISIVQTNLHQTELRLWLIDIKMSDSVQMTGYSGWFMSVVEWVLWGVFVLFCAPSAKIHPSQVISVLYSVSGTHGPAIRRGTSAVCTCMEGQGQYEWL